MYSRSLVMLTLVPLLLGSACSILQPNAADVLESADAAFREGQLPDAFNEVDKARTEHPNLREVQLRAAYAYMLAGDHDLADEVLAKLQDGADPEESNELALRRALNALAAGEFDAVGEHGMASQTAAGFVMAAEVRLADAEVEDAITLLKQARDKPGRGADTADKYLELLESGDMYRAGLAEATALWALGDRTAACDTAEELVKGLDSADRGELLLVWAGRCVTSERPAIAASLIEEAKMSEVDPDQAWRLLATDALVSAAEGDCAASAAWFAALEVGGAPADGLADAKATAVALNPDEECLALLGEPAFLKAGPLRDFKNR